MKKRPTYRLKGNPLTIGESCVDETWTDEKLRQEGHFLSRVEARRSIIAVINKTESMSKTEKELADKIITEMTKAGLEPDRMLVVIEQAKEIYQILKKTAAMKRKVININTLQKKKFHTRELEGKWATLLGQVERNFTAMFYGPSGGGKSTLVLELADYLARKYGKVFYNSWEEGFNLTIQKRAEFIGITSKRLFIGNRLPFDEMVDRIRKCHYQFIFLDSIQFMAFTYEQHKELTTLFPRKSFIYISQGTGVGKTDGANPTLFAVDCKVHVSGGVTQSSSRFLPTPTRMVLFTPKKATTSQQTLQL